MIKQQQTITININDIKIGDEMLAVNGEKIKVSSLMDQDRFPGCVGAKRWIKSKQKWSGVGLIRRVIDRD